VRLTALSTDDFLKCEALEKKWNIVVMRTVFRAARDAFVSHAQDRKKFVAKIEVRI